MRRRTILISLLLVHECDVFVVVKKLKRQILCCVIFQAPDLFLLLSHFCYHFLLPPQQSLAKTAILTRLIIITFDTTITPTIQLSFRCVNINIIKINFEQLVFGRCTVKSTHPSSSPITIAKHIMIQLLQPFNWPSIITITQNITSNPILLKHSCHHIFQPQQSLLQHYITTPSIKIESTIVMNVDFGCSRQDFWFLPLHQGDEPSTWPFASMMVSVDGNSQQEWGSKGDGIIDYSLMMGPVHE